MTTNNTLSETSSTTATTKNSSDLSLNSSPFHWYVPSTMGDLKLERVSDTTCRLIVQEATSEERQALIKLEAIARKKKWITQTAQLIEDGAIHSTLIGARTDKVAELLAKTLKPNKKIVHAVKFSNGKIEEMTEQTFKTSEKAKTQASVATSTTPATSEPVAAPVAGTSVAKPVVGCPPPDFSPARLRARAVLTAFLTPEQREDFERYNKFVTLGATTGHRYMITSRTNREALQRYERTLYDLDDQRALCIHEYSVPPEEEMHTLNVLIQLPGYEAYCRHLETA